MKFSRRATRINLLASQRDSVAEVSRQTSDYESSGRVHEREIALRSSYFAAEHSGQRLCVFGRIAPAKICERAGRDPKPATIQNRGGNPTVIQLRESGRSAR